MISIFHIILQELCRRWEQYVLDHQAYTASFDQCKGWVVNMRKKLATQSDVKGDKRTVQERIERLKVSMRILKKSIIEPQHEISNNVVCATSKASDQPAHMRSLIRAFASIVT